MRAGRCSWRRPSCRLRPSSRRVSPRRRRPSGAVGRKPRRGPPEREAMKVEEISELDVDTLRVREKELDDQLFRLRIQKSMGQLEAPAKVRGVRKDLARVKTILREKAK